MPFHPEHHVLLYFCWLYLWFGKRTQGFGHRRSCLKFRFSARQLFAGAVSNQL